MGSNYKKLGPYIQVVNERNSNLNGNVLLGVSVKKCFIPSIANTVGTDFAKYKIVRRNQFTYIPDTSRRGEKIGLALLEDYDEALVSQAYTVFKIIDTNKLDPEYLMMWFRRPEFDRYARVKSHGSVREIFDWSEMCDIELPIPSIEKQRVIVDEYNTIVNRITLNEKLNQKLEETAQAIYKQWFVDFEFPNEDGKPYKSEGGAMVWCEELDKEIPEGWEYNDLGSLIEVISGFAFKSDEFYDFGKYPIIKIKNIKSPYVFIQEDTKYYIENITKNMERIVSIKGDILISMTGSGANQINSAVGQVGKYYYKIPALLNQRVGKLFPNRNFNKEFVYQYISSDEIQSELLNGSTGSANQANISPSQIKELKILIPTDSLLMKFSEITLAIDNFKSLEVIDKLKDLNDLLLSKMTKVEFEKTILN